MERLVQCLSPVHIGTGRNVEPFDYILEGSRYIRVNLDALVARLSEEQAARLAGWVSERADRMAALDEQVRQQRRGPERGDLNRQLLELRREFNMLGFTRDHAAELRQALLEDEELALYKGRGAPDRNLQVREQLKEADGTPLIPGSSIKGAIRTALAFATLKEMPQPEQETVMRQVERAVTRAAEERQRDRMERVPRRWQERIGQEIEKEIFRCGQKRDDIHYDLMRAISLSDCQAERAELIVPQVYTFVEQRTQGEQRGDELAAQAPIIVEAHAPGNVFRLRINVDGKLLKAILARRGQEGDKWTGFEEQVRRVFGSQVAGMLATVDTEMSPEEVQKFEEALKGAVLERIEMACRGFARELIEAEARWAEKFAASKVFQFYEQLRTLGEEVVPLRLGWGSDFLSTTLLLALRKDAAWQGVLERCFRVFDIGLPPGRKPREGWAGRAVNLDGFPTSRRLVAVNRSPVAPFGWIALASSAGRLPEPLVAVEEIVQPARTEERLADTGRRGPGPGHAGGRRPQPRREVPSRKPAPPLKMPAMPKRQSQPMPSSGPRVGERINAEVIEKEGGRVRVRLADGPELNMEWPVCPRSIGETIKVRVAKVDASGRVTKVVP